MDKKRSVKPWDLLNPNTKYVSEEIFNNRYKICTTCEFFIRHTNQCSKCMCLMKIKCTMADAFCPENKWDSHEEEVSE